MSSSAFFAEEWEPQMSPRNPRALSQKLRRPGISFFIPIGQHYPHSALRMFEKQTEQNEYAERRALDFVTAAPHSQLTSS
jgi:hypothetical protein